MFKRTCGFLILITIALLIAGCSTMGKMQKLDDTLRNYEGAIRWSEFEIASGFGVSKEPVPDLERLNSIKVTSYQVKNRNVLEKKLEAKQTVVIQYYDINSMMEQSIVHNQQWNYDEDRQQWLVRPSLPDF